VARAGLYREFGSKQRLYAEALGRYRTAEHDRFARCGADASGALATIEAMFQLLVDQSVDAQRPPGCFVVAAIAERVPDDPDTTAQVTAQVAALDALFVALLTQAVDAGEIASGIDPGAHGRALTAAFLGLRTIATVRPDRAVLDEIVTTVLSPLRRASCSWEV
jgi:TetR/AcrR family transcriptional regulator, transcriptional repressor for nem operon